MFDFAHSFKLPIERVHCVRSQFIPTLPQLFRRMFAPVKKKLQAIGIKRAMLFPVTFSVEYIGSKMRFHSPSDAQNSLNSLEVNSEESPLHELGEMLDRLITREEEGWLSHS